MLPPIGSQQKQEQQQPSGVLKAACSSSLLPAIIQDGPALPAVVQATSEDKVAKCIEQEKLKCLLGPLKGWCRQEAQRLITEEAVRVSEEIRLHAFKESNSLNGLPSSLSPVDLRTPSVLRALPFVNTPSPPAVPAPPHTAKPQTTRSGQLCSRLPRLKKTASLSVATSMKGEYRHTQTYT